MDLKKLFHLIEIGYFGKCNITLDLDPSSESARFDDIFQLDKCIGFYYQVELVLVN